MALQNSRNKKQIVRLNKSRRRLLISVLLAGCGATVYFLIARLTRIRSAEVLASLCGSNCETEQPFHAGVQDNYAESEQRQLKELLGSDFDPEKVSVLVEKSAYRLTVFYDLEPVKIFPVVFGSAPVGDKFAEGDRKTPEGIYRVRDLYPHPDWSKFIWLDYPTPQDWREHDEAKVSGAIAPNATIGSEVGIHGVPTGSDDLIDRRTNWTWGCVSLKNEDVDEIYEVLAQGTLIEVVP